MSKGNWFELLLVCLLASCVALAGCGGGSSSGKKKSQEGQDPDQELTAYDIAVINGFEGTEAQYEMMTDGIESESCVEARQGSQPSPMPSPSSSD